MAGASGRCILNSYRNSVKLHNFYSLVSFPLPEFHLRKRPGNHLHPERKFSIQATYEKDKFRAPDWPPGETSVTRRYRYGQYVERRKSEAKKTKHLAARGLLKPRSHPPENGLLIKGLVPVAYQTMAARGAVLDGLQRLLQKKRAFACSSCSEVFVGPAHYHQVQNCTGKGMHSRRGHHLWIPASAADLLGELESYHLWDRISSIVAHDYRFQVPRIPSIVELCIQAGLDMAQYPTVRRSKPVIGRPPVNPHYGPPPKPKQWSIEDRLNEVMWEAGSQEEKVEADMPSDVPLDSGEVMDEYYSTMGQLCLSKAGLEVWQWNVDEKGDELPPLQEDPDLVRVANRTVTAWLLLRDGVDKLMSKYPVFTCGYCTEVHVGPRGHKVRLCDGGKQQWRVGQHGWQRAVLDDIFPPKYVFDISQRNKPLVNPLRVYYGMAPAVVELCVQCGADIPQMFKAMMRLDVALPDVEEIEKAV